MKPPLLLFSLLLLALCALLLPSCAGMEGMPPVKACVKTDQGTVCYGEDGLTGEIDVRSGK